MQSSSVDAAVAAFDAWSFERAPTLSGVLAPPVDPSSIVLAERLFHRPLDRAYTRWLLHHDGQRLDTSSNTSDDLVPLVDGIELLPLAMARLEYLGLCATRDSSPTRLSDSFDPVRPVRFHPGWWPFARVSREGTYLCIDHVPDLGGTPGQVIQVDLDAAERLVVAPSLGHWLHRLFDLVSKPGTRITGIGVSLSESAWMSLLGLDLVPMEDDPFELDTVPARPGAAREPGERISGERLIGGFDAVWPEVASVDVQRKR